jgi:hypothetical protein
MKMEEDLFFFKTRMTTSNNGIYDDLKKNIEEDLQNKWKTTSKRNERQPQKEMKDNLKKWKTTSKRMEDDLKNMKKWKTTTSTIKNMHSIQYTVLYALYSLHCTLVFYTLYYAYCILGIVLLA